MSRRVLMAIGVVVAVLVVGTVTLNVLGSRRRECSAVGCTSAVTFDLATFKPGALRAATSATVCVNSTCMTTALTAGQPWVRTKLDERTVRSGSLTIADAAGREVGHFDLAGEHQAEESTPNGPDCEPTCWRLNLAIADGSLRSETDEQLRAHSIGTR